MPVKHCETAILFRRYVCSSCIFSCALLLYTHTHTQPYFENSPPQTTAFAIAPLPPRANVERDKRFRLVAHARCPLSRSQLLLQRYYVGCIYSHAKQHCVWAVRLYIVWRTRALGFRCVCVCIRILSNFEKFLYIWWRQRRLLYSQETRVCRKL